MIHKDYEKLVKSKVKNRNKTKNALYAFLERDRKKYKNEIVYAIASLGRIGTADDIPALEKFLEVRIQDMRIAAEFAIGRIKERS